MKVKAECVRPRRWKARARWCQRLPNPRSLEKRRLEGGNRCQRRFQNHRLWRRGQCSGKTLGRFRPRDRRSGKTRSRLPERFWPGIEKSTNERNKAINPEKAESHRNVSAKHGPGTDQISRLVVGRRPDEIETETSKGKTPSKKVALCDGQYRGHFRHRKCPCTHKSRAECVRTALKTAFTSNMAMLHTVEEALIRRSAQLDSHLETIVKQEFRQTLRRSDEEAPRCKTAFRNSSSSRRRAVQVLQTQLRNRRLTEKQVRRLATASEVVRKSGE